MTDDSLLPIPPATPYVEAEIVPLEEETAEAATTRPDYLKTELGADYSITLKACNGGATPTYQRVLVSDDTGDDNASAVSKEDYHAWNEDDLPLDVVARSSCRTKWVTGDGARIVLLCGNAITHRFSDQSGVQLAIEGRRSTHYIVPEGSACAFEIEESSSLRHELDADRMPITDGSKPRYYPVMSSVDINDRWQSRADRCYWNPPHEKIRFPDVPMDVSQYKDAEGVVTNFTFDASSAHVDFGMLTFYDIVRYTQVIYAAKKAKVNEYLIQLTHERPGMMARYETLMVNAETMTTHRCDDKTGDRSKTILQRLDENGYDMSGYQEIPIAGLSDDLCKKLGSYQGAMQYVTPANCRKVVHAFAPSLVNA